MLGYDLDDVLTDGDAKEGFCPGEKRDTALATLCYDVTDLKLTNHIDLNDLELSVIEIQNVLDPAGTGDYSKSEIVTLAVQAVMENADNVTREKLEAAVQEYVTRTENEET